MFEVGEIINPDHWGLQLRITSIKPLEGVITKNEAPASYVGKFFPIGRVLRFEQSGSDTSWIIVSNDKDMPWYILGIYEGRKRFEHYR